MLEQAVTVLTDWFRNADPTVQFAILVVLIIVVVGLTYWRFRDHFKLDKVRGERDELRIELRARELEAAEVKSALANSSSLASELQAEAQKLAEERGKLGQQLGDANEKLVQLRESLERAEVELKTLQQRFDDLQEIDTDVWLGPVGSDSTPPKLVAKSERPTRLVAFLNLKGGVGKTTLVANLAGAYSTAITGTHQRVLIVDLDYQGTLSNMSVRTDILLQMRESKNTADRLIADGTEAMETERILGPLFAPLEGSGGFGKVIVANEQLDHADFRQQARFAVERREMRFHHRRIFHDRYVFENFDFVFFDCPPRLSTSTVNALAAADYIVIPTSLHPNDVDAVPRTLRWLEKLQAIHDFQAKLAGVILNRTFRKGTVESLTKDEQNLCVVLEKSVQRFLPTGGAILQNVVPNSAEVARFAAGSVPLGANAAGHDVYADAALELFNRLRG